MNDSFTIKIADLGYARELEGAGMASTICGTPITMAPDIAINNNNNEKHEYNNKADLWSLGACTYELLIGQPPFYARTYQELFQQINNGKYTLPKNMKLSVEVITFINGLLAEKQKMEEETLKLKEELLQNKEIDNLKISEEKNKEDEIINKKIDSLDDWEDLTAKSINLDDEDSNQLINDFVILNKPENEEKKE